MRRSNEVRIGLLTASLAAFLAGCDGAPDPALNSNESVFTSQHECELLYGAGECEGSPARGGGSAAYYFYRGGYWGTYPHYTPSESHYYRGSAPAVRHITSPFSSSGSSVMSGVPRISSPGGFGARGIAIGGGGA